MATGVLKVLNNLAILDLKFMQRMLVSQSISLTTYGLFFDIVAFQSYGHYDLLKVCAIFIPKNSFALS